MSKATPQQSLILLDPGLRSPGVMDFEQSLRDRVIGQSEAVQEIVNVYQTYIAGMTSSRRTMRNLLLLGPTGTGKTKVVEAAADILFGSPDRMIKIDCAEFQHSHEISKIIGSPPGYLGHRETPPLLTQAAIQKLKDESKTGMCFILFDEIEKGNEALYQLMLSILETARLTLGNNQAVDFSDCVIFMTSNLGAVEMRRLHEGGIGYTSKKSLTEYIDDPNLYAKLKKTALEAAKKQFAPEFLNRIDNMIVFHSLTSKDLRTILDLELSAISKRLMDSHITECPILTFTQKAKDFLVREGTNAEYGARELKRIIERHIVVPISNIISTHQVILGNIVRVDLAPDGKYLQFFKEKMTI